MNCSFESKSGSSRKCNDKQNKCKSNSISIQAVFGISNQPSCSNLEEKFSSQFCKPANLIFDLAQNWSWNWSPLLNVNQFRGADLLPQRFLFSFKTMPGLSALKPLGDSAHGLCRFCSSSFMRSHPSGFGIGACVKAAAWSTWVDFRSSWAVNVNNRRVVFQCATENELEKVVALIRMFNCEHESG